MSKYIVEIEPRVYLAPWIGDPGRTLVKRNARRFQTVRSATFGIYEARKYGDFPNAVILEVEARIKENRE